MKDTIENIDQEKQEIENVAMQKLMQDLLKNEVKSKKEVAKSKVNRLQNND